MNLNKLISCLFCLALSINVYSQPALPMRVSVSGTGKSSVVLIPGFTCSGKVWDETVHQLEKHYTCYVITFAGFAGEPAQADPHLKNWVADIAHFIKDRHLNKPAIIGRSIGGGMAMMLAAKYPALVSKIIVIDALPCLSALQNPSFKAKPGADCNSFIAQYTAMSDSALFSLQQRTVPMLCTDTTMQPEIVQWSMQSDRTTMGQIYCEFLNTDLRDTIASIQCPAYILLEAPFKAYDASMKQQFAKLPNMQIVYAEKGRHFIMYDDKEWYLHQLSKYLP